MPLRECKPAARRARRETEKGGRPELGFSLVELLIVVSLMGIFAGLVLTRWEPNLHDQLLAAAQVVTADLAHARALAVSGGSTYKFTFDVENNQYWLEHSGSNASLDVLPDTPFRSRSDPEDRQIMQLASLPLAGGHVELAAVQQLTPDPVLVTDLEFGPLGETTRAFETVVWLAAGTGPARRYLSVHVEPVTGLTSVGQLEAAPPLGAVSSAPES